MKTTIFYRAAALLAAAAVFTSAFVPASLARYNAAAVSSASARVAKWTVTIPVSTATTSVRNGSAYVFYNSSNINNGVSTSKTTAISHTFVVKNESEVAAHIKLQAHYIVVDGTDHINSGQPNGSSSATGYLITYSATTTGTVTHVSGNGTGVCTYYFAPGAQATFTLAVAQHSTATTTRAVRIVATGTQVD